MQLSFYGAAGTVTGSKTLFEAKGKRILVDCGLFQGLKSLRLKNRNPLPFHPRTIDAVVLTHAHLDHSGALPLLVKEGFSGKIYCTKPTEEIARIILSDFAHLEEEDAMMANRYGYSKHKPALPLYTMTDVQACMRQIEAMEYAKRVDLAPALSVEFHDVGHIMGSSRAAFFAEGKRVVFSGDVGRARPLTLRPREKLGDVDVLILESTYGDRCHPKTRPADDLENVILDTLKKKGNILIPSFAVGRAQDLLFLLSDLKRRKRIPQNLPVYLDSPMAIEVSEVFVRLKEWQRLKIPELKEMFSTVKMVHKKEEKILRRGKSAIVIAGSGMATGGRILGHLAECLPDSRNTVVLTGFQAPGTRGRLLQDGAGEVKIQGQYIPVRAEIRTISSLSAHADQKELLTWLQPSVKRGMRIFLNHGEPQACDALRLHIKDAFGIDAIIPGEGAVFTL